MDQSFLEGIATRAAETRDRMGQSDDAADARPSVPCAWKTDEASKKLAAMGLSEVAADRMLPPLLDALTDFVGMVDEDKRGQLEIVVRHADRVLTLGEGSWGHLGPHFDPMEWRQEIFAAGGDPRNVESLANISRRGFSGQAEANRLCSLLFRPDSQGGKGPGGLGPHRHTHFQGDCYGTLEELEKAPKGRTDWRAWEMVKGRWNQSRSFAAPGSESSDRRGWASAAPAAAAVQSAGPGWPAPARRQGRSHSAPRLALPCEGSKGTTKGGWPSWEGGAPWWSHWSRGNDGY